MPPVAHPPAREVRPSSRPVLEARGGRGTNSSFGTCRSPSGYIACRAPPLLKKPTSLPFLHGCSPPQHPIHLCCVSPRAPPSRKRPPYKENRVEFSWQCGTGMSGCLSA
ncbi:hypothetical protein VZT92_026372 [Zoarces viviparus]|uniref:Uncharacterized protein n=1 Tax=Zoarces viviparus TaxID=48416 RepID=A0AAW1E0Q5_ZOAVI